MNPRSHVSRRARSRQLRARARALSRDRRPSARPRGTSGRGAHGLLALWARWRRGEGEMTDDWALFGAALAALNLMGATLSGLWLALPHSGRAHEGTILCATIGAYILGTFLVVGQRAKPRWMLQLSIALDTLVISIALVATGDSGSVYAFYYLWATLYAVCFFTGRQIAAQALWAGSAYAASLALIGDRPAGELISQWLLPMSTLLAAGTLVRQLTGRLRRGEARMRHDAGHDPLTGLLSRARFDERLSAALEQPGEAPVCVVFIDLDHFKRINDSLGHALGDALLVAVTERLQRDAPAGALLARFGGDEFLAMSRTLDPETDAERWLESFDRPFEVGGYELAVTASLGIARACPGEDAQTVVRHADAAVYSAKHHGRARSASFDASLRGALSNRLQIENDLRKALEHDELGVAYQPLVTLDDRSIIGAEALARWTHPLLGPIAPDVFVAVAEQSGLIDLLGERVLEVACRDAARWIHSLPAFWMSVNLSARQLDTADLIPRIERILSRTGLPHRNLTLEVTETSVLSEDARARENLFHIRDAGIGLALDDFGTGYSSLSHLSIVQFDLIKLDRSFISADDGPTGDAIVSAVASIGHATGASVLAEGIETAEHHERVQRLGCGYGQGWYFGRPIPAGEFDALVRRDIIPTEATWQAGLDPAAGAVASAPAAEFVPQPSRTR